MARPASSEECGSVDPVSSAWMQVYWRLKAVWRVFEDRQWAPFSELVHEDSVNARLINGYLPTLEMPELLTAWHNIQVFPFERFAEAYATIKEEEQAQRIENVTSRHADAVEELEQPFLEMVRLLGSHRGNPHKPGVYRQGVLKSVDSKWAERWKPSQRELETEPPEGDVSFWQKANVMNPIILTVRSREWEKLLATFDDKYARMIADRAFPDKHDLRIEAQILATHIMEFAQAWYSTFEDAKRIVSLSVELFEKITKDIFETEDIVPLEADLWMAHLNSFEEIRATIHNDPTQSAVLRLLLL